MAAGGEPPRPQTGRPSCPKQPSLRPANPRVSEGARGAPVPECGHASVWVWCGFWGGGSDEPVTSLRGGARGARRAIIGQSPGEKGGAAGRTVVQLTSCPVRHRRLGKHNTQAFELQRAVKTSGRSLVFILRSQRSECGNSSFVSPLAFLKKLMDTQQGWDRRPQTLISKPSFLLSFSYTCPHFPRGRCPLPGPTPTPQGHPLPVVLDRGSFIPVPGLDPFPSVPRSPPPPPPPQRDVLSPSSTHTPSKLNGKTLFQSADGECQERNKHPQDIQRHSQTSPLDQGGRSWSVCRFAENC